MRERRIAGFSLQPLQQPLEMDRALGAHEQDRARVPGDGIGGDDLGVVRYGDLHVLA